MFNFKNLGLSLFGHIIFLIIISLLLPKVNYPPKISNNNNKFKVVTVESKKIKTVDLLHIKPKRNKIIKNIDIYTLSKCIYFEARNQSRIGQLAVISVILSRVKSKKYPNTIYDVVFQPHQFSWTSSTVKIDDIDTYLDIYNLCYSIIQGKVKCLSINSTHYYADYINPPYWTKKMKRVIKIDNHIFYREYKTI